MSSSLHFYEEEYRNTQAGHASVSFSLPSFLATSHSAISVSLFLASTFLYYVDTTRHIMLPFIPSFISSLLKATASSDNIASAAVQLRGGGKCLFYYWTLWCASGHVDMSYIYLQIFVFLNIKLRGLNKK